MSTDVEQTRNGTRPSRRKPSRPGVDGLPPLPVPPRLPGRRNPRWIALGVIAICLGGLLAYAVYARVSTETRVLAVTATVYRGEVVEASDLTTVVLHGDPPGPTVAAADEATVVGRRAVFDLPAGSLVGPGSLTDVTVPDGALWVMGDNRERSADSRSHVTGPYEGFVPLDHVVGRATVVFWPLGRWAVL